MKNELPTLLIADKTVGRSGERIMVMLEISMQPIDKIMFENNVSNGLGETGEAYLVGEDLLMRSSSRFHENSIYNTVVNTKGVQLAFKDSVSAERISDCRNVMVLSLFGKVNVGRINWAILAEIDYAEAMVPITEIRNNIFYLLLIIGLFLLGVIAVVSQMITAPIKKLRQATDKIVDGKYGETLDLKINDEIGDLITAFNQMTTRLRFQSEKLEEQKVMSLQSLIDGQEIERQRLSRELHDGLAQLILAIKMRAERALNSEPSLSQQIITDIQELLSQALTEIRNISNDLMPAVLNEFGIRQAVSYLISEIGKTHAFSIDYNCTNKLSVNSKKVETYAYRIIQETFSNIIKHANAKTVQLCLSIQNDGLVVDIQDDGNGFDVRESINSMGNGISNMKERVLLLGGEFKLTSKVGFGTKLYAKIPI